MTGVIFEDLIRPLLKKPMPEAAASLVMKVMVMIIGLVCVAMVFIVEHMGTLVQAGKSLAGITAGPLLGVFSMGMFFPWANSNVSFYLLHYVYHIYSSPVGKQVADSVTDHSALISGIAFQEQYLNLHWKLNQDSSMSKIPG
jgi:hypothetical protein